MSIESNLKRIADSNDAIVALLTASANLNTPHDIQPVAPVAVAPVAVAPVAVAPVAPVAPVAVLAPVAVAPVTPVAVAVVAPVLTAEILDTKAKAKAAALGDGGAAIMAVITQFGVQGLAQLDPSQYVAFDAAMAAL